MKPFFHQTSFVTVTFFIAVMVILASCAGYQSTGGAWASESPTSSGDHTPQTSPVQGATHSKTATPTDTPHGHNEPRPYDAKADARTEVDAALKSARENGTMALIVMGANWCHDSRGLAAHFEKPRFQSLIEQSYERVYVDVGRKNRNVDIAQSFGIENIVGTPTVFVVSRDGEVLNLDTAPTWRNAASRTEDEIYDYFASFVTP